MCNAVSTSTISKEYRKRNRLSQAKFGKALTASLVNFTLTRQAISQWELGDAEPSIELLLYMYIVYSDWRRDFAIDALCAKLPEIFARDERGALTMLRPLAG